MLRIQRISFPKDVNQADEGALNICPTTDLLFEVTPNAPSKRMALAAIAGKLMGYLVGFAVTQGVEADDIESIYITEMVEGKLRHFQLVNASTEIMDTTVPAYDYSKATYRRTFVGQGYVLNTWLEVPRENNNANDD